MRIINRKGQSTLEYAILIIIIIAALVSLQTYIKRGVQGRLKGATDDISDGFSIANGANYQKSVVSVSNTVENAVAGTTSTIIASGGVMTTDTVSNIQMNSSDEYWFK
jgi:uncharacterized protein (UPF0333 family)